MSRIARPQRAESEETRQRILDVSQRLFAARGFDGTGIEQIATEAGIAKSLIYYYFENKEGLLQAVLDRYLDYAIELKKQITADVVKDPERHLNGAIDRALDVMEGNVDVIRIMVMESLKDPSSDRILQHVRRGLDAGFEAVRAQGIEGFDEKDLLLKNLFFGFLPLTSFTLFRDRWCDLVGADRAWARQLFASTFSDIYMRLMEAVLSRGEPASSNGGRIGPSDTESP